MLGWLYLITVFLVLEIDGEDICTGSSYGTEFIFGFMDLPFYKTGSVITEPQLKIRVRSKRSTATYVSIPNTDTASKTPTWSTKRYYVYTHLDIPFNATFINKYNSDDAGRSIRIKSDYPISVVAVYSIPDTYLIPTPILPVTALSTSYVLPSYHPNTASYSGAQILVVALYDSTVVSFNGYDMSQIKRLDQNETYVYLSSRDISGTSVSSNHPVAIFTSVTKGYNSYTSTINNGRRNTEFLAMEVPPVGKFATHFIVPSLPNDVKTYKVRIYAAQEARVEIHTTSGSTTHMHVYEKIYYEYTTKGSSTLEILSDTSIMVVQIALNSIGEAMFMTNIPALSQYLSSYLTDLESSSQTTRTYVVTVRYEEALGLLLDGDPALHNPAMVAHRTPLGNYTVFMIPMTSRDVVSHVGDEPFGLLIYEHYERLYTSFSYGYSAGMQLKTDCQQTTSSSPIIG